MKMVPRAEIVVTTNPWNSVDRSWTKPSTTLKKPKLACALIHNPPRRPAIRWSSNTIFGIGIYRLVTKKTSAGSDYILRETPDRTQDKNTIVTVGAYDSDSDAPELASSSAVCRKDKIAAVSVVARLGTLEWSVRLGLGASPEIIFLGAKNLRKDAPLIPKFGENSFFFFHKRVVNFSPFFSFWQACRKSRIN